MGWVGVPAQGRLGLGMGWRAALGVQDPSLRHGRGQAGFTTGPGGGARPGLRRAAASRLPAAGLLCVSVTVRSHKCVCACGHRGGSGGVFVSPVWARKGGGAAASPARAKTAGGTRPAPGRWVGFGWVPERQEERCP